MTEKNIIIGQSGGPTAVINSSLYGVIAESFKHPDRITHVYGMINGIEGFLKGLFLDLKETLSESEQIALTYTPGAYLGSCRFKLPESLEDKIYPTLFQKFAELNIGYFFYIGGNDSMDTVNKLSKYALKTGNEIRIIGIPKTIDNDLIDTDHTPGFGSAAKYVASTVREIVLDASVYEKKSVTIVEIMGRHAGWLTAASVLARKYIGDNPVFLYLPESDFNLDDFLQNIQKAFEKKCNLVVCVSEGIHDKNGTFICEYDSKAEVDSFGHKMLTGCGKFLENIIRNRLGVKARSIELNVNQRCSSFLMSETDRQEAIHSGKFGVQAAINGETGKMVSIKRLKDNRSSYKCEYVLSDVNKICNAEKPFPKDWITKNGTDITEEFIFYVSPLIQGNVEIPLGPDGLPEFIYRKGTKTSMETI